MKTQHMPHHWLLVTLVVLACLLAVSELHGQNLTSDPTFQGRPAMAGAQGGLGAMAGPPQGGIGLQGTAGVGPTVRPAIVRNDTVNGPGLANGGARVLEQDSEANRAVVDDNRVLRDRRSDRAAPADATMR